MSSLAAIHDVLLERARQDKKWGKTSRDYLGWMSILAEEVGEAAGEVNEIIYSGGRFDADVKSRLTTEITHVAAVAVAIIEQLKSSASASMVKAQLLLLEVENAKSSNEALEAIKKNKGKISDFIASYFVAHSFPEKFTQSSIQLVTRHASCDDPVEWIDFVNAALSIAGINVGSNLDRNASLYIL
jgi:hypothetical protein